MYSRSGGDVRRNKYGNIIRHATEYLFPFKFVMPSDSQNILTWLWLMTKSCQTHICWMDSLQYAHNSSSATSIVPFNIILRGVLVWWTHCDEYLSNGYTWAPTKCTKWTNMFTDTNMILDDIYLLKQFNHEQTVINHWQESFIRELISDSNVHVHMFQLKWLWCTVVTVPVHDWTYETQHSRIIFHSTLTYAPPVLYSKWMTYPIRRRWWVASQPTSVVWNTLLRINVYIHICIHAHTHMNKFHRRPSTKCTYTPIAPNGINHPSLNG
jgi:hypothetical protein